MISAGKAEDEGFRLANHIACPELSLGFLDLLSWMRRTGPEVEVCITPVAARVLCRGACFAELIPHPQVVQVRFGLETRWEARIATRAQAAGVGYEILRALCRERAEQFLD